MEMPTVRNLSPLKSSGFVIGFLYQPSVFQGLGAAVNALPGGEIVAAMDRGLLDAVSKGVLDGGHGVLVYHYGKQTALALWGSGPGYAMDANMLLDWHKYGGGKELLNKLYNSI